MLLLALTFLSLAFDPLGIYSGYEKVSIFCRQLGLKLASCSTIFIAAIFLYVLFLHFKSTPKVCLAVKNYIFIGDDDLNGTYPLKLMFFLAYSRWYFTALS